MKSYSFPPEGGGFRAQYLGAVDGDTIDFLIDMGFSVYHKVRVRLAGLDTPELHSPSLEVRAAAQKARLFVHEALIARTAEGSLTDYPVDWPIRLVTAKGGADKYGRYLAEVFYQSPTGEKVLVEKNLNTELVTQGYAKLYDGGKK